MPAIIALPDIGLVIIGLVLLALAYALYLLRDLLVGAFSNVPVIGGWIASGLGSVLDTARRAVVSGADAAFSGAERLFIGIGHWATRMFDEVISAAAETLITLEHVVTHQIPAAFDAARAFAAAAALRVYHDALNWYHDALAYAQRQASAARAAGLAAAAAVAAQLAAFEHTTAVAFDAVRHDLAADFAAAKAWTDTRVDATVRWAAGEITAAAASVRAYALGLFDTAEHDIAAAAAAARAFAAAAAARAEHDARAGVDLAATAGLAIPWAGIITDLEQLDATLAAGWRDIRDAVDAIPRAVPGDIAGVVSALGALAIPALRAMDDCVLPQCRDLGGLRSFLHDLLGIASTAAVFAWLVYCIADPVAAADDTAAVGGPVAADTLGALERLFGVPV